MASFTKNKAAFAPPKDQPTLVKTGLRQRLSTGMYLFLAFFVPFILMFTAFAIAEVSPFGDNVIFVTDLFHQYFPFLTDFQSKLQSGGSLLWTWRSGGGTNYLGLMAYYTASPLNLLTYFVPPEALKEFVYVCTCVKIGLAGLFFALFLRITFKRRDVALTAFGIMYALCAFIMGYYWNIIWLDTVALLPLVVAGTIALLREGKFRLYIVALALSLISNYYIGLFTCIFVVFVSVGYTIVEFKSWRKILRDFFKMAGCTIVSVMISAVLLLPAYLALKQTHSSNNTFPKLFAVNMGGTADFAGVLSGMGKTIASTLSLMKPTPKDGLPNVYCGVFVIFLAILFLFCSKIKKRERIYCAGLLIFFMLSFVIRQLDYIWHGFHFPNQLPHRFSFLFCFVVIYMAFRVFMHIDSVRPVAVIAAICGFIVYLGIAYGYYHFKGTGTYEPNLSELFASADGASGPDPVIISGFFGLLMAAWVLLYSFRSYLKPLFQAICSACIGVATIIFIILFADVFTAPLRHEKPESSSSSFVIIAIIVLSLIIAAIFIALCSKQLNRDNRALRISLSVVLIALALTEGLFSAASGVKAVGVYDGRYYPLGTDKTRSLVDTINQREQNTVDVYRTEFTEYHTLNDPSLLGVNGVSMFSSMVNSNITDYMEKFGICGWIESNRYTYQYSSPFTNLMLNIKYLIGASSDSVMLDETHLSMVTDLGTYNPKLMQNKYYLPMGFMVKDSLLQYDIENLPRTNPISNQNRFFRLATGFNSDLYEEVETRSDSETKISAVAPYDGVAVVYCTVPYNAERDYGVTINNGSASYKANMQRPFIALVGSVTKGTELSCTSNASFSGQFAMMNEDMFQKAYKLFSRSTLKATEVTDTAIRGNIDVAEDGLFYTSIPCIKGWKARVDGEEVELTPVSGAMLAFKVSKGPHIIELTYQPDGYPLCLIVSIAGLVIYIAMIVLSLLKINFINIIIKKRPVKKRAAAVAAAPGGERAPLSPASDGEPQPPISSSPDEEPAAPEPADPAPEKPAGDEASPSDPDQEE